MVPPSMAVVDGDEQRGVIHHVPVAAEHAAPGHTAAGPWFLRRSAPPGRNTAAGPAPPSGRPALAGDHRLHAYAAAPRLQGQGGLAEIKIRPLGHTAQKMAHPLVIGRLQRLVQPLFQRDTARVRLVVPPGAAFPGGAR